MTHKTITTEEEFDLLNPIQNHLDNNASLDGCMFETFGAELDFVRSQPDSHIWTYAEEGNILFLSSGYHLVNRLGYLVTKHPYDGEYTTVRLADLSEMEDEMQSQDEEGHP